MCNVQAKTYTTRRVPEHSNIHTLAPVDYKRESGRRLAKARNDRGWTLAKLSKEVKGVLSPARISNYEQGIRQMKSQEALVLGQALGVEPSFLLCVDREEEGDMTPQEQQLLRNFRALPENERGAYARRIEVLALAYREPVPDERLGDSWTSPTAKGRRRKTTK